MIQPIIDRRSIRKYKSDPIPQAAIEAIIKSATLAPSSKNRQPWKFIAVSGKSKCDMLKVMSTGLDREKSDPVLPGSARFIKGAEYTLDIMQQAPVVIFVMNTLGIDLNQTLTPEERIYEICNAQSIGAAIENMTLTATDLGLGSLWICDTYFAYRELCDWLHSDGELLAALAIGYADEAPVARPRKGIESLIEWRG